MGNRKTEKLKNGKAEKQKAERRGVGNVVDGRGTVVYSWEYMAEEAPKDSGTTALGLPRNTAAALCYAMGFLPLMGWLTGLIFLIFEKDKLIRFHALQSLALFGVFAVVQLLVSSTDLLGRLFSLLFVGQFLLWLMLMYKTYQGEKWVLPYVGTWAEGQLAKMKGS